MLWITLVPNMSILFGYFTFFDQKIAFQKFSTFFGGFKLTIYNINIKQYIKKEFSKIKIRRILNV